MSTNATPIAIIAGAIIIAGSLYASAPAKHSSHGYSHRSHGYSQERSQERPNPFNP